MSAQALPMPVGADLEHCQVVGRDAIVGLLREVATRHALLTIHFGEGREAIVSTLLEADPLRGGVIVDCGSDAAANARLLAASRLTVVTMSSMDSRVAPSDGGLDRNSLSDQATN